MHAWHSSHYPLRFSSSWLKWTSHLSPKVFMLLTTMNLSPFLIRVKASARRINQLDNCVLPCKALYWPYTVPREILFAILYALANKFALFSQVYSTTGKQVSPPFSPSAELTNFLYHLTLRLVQNFFTHNLSIKRHQVAFMRMWISYYPKVFKFLTTIRHFQASQPLFGKSDRKNKLFKFKI